MSDSAVDKPSKENVRAQLERLYQQRFLAGTLRPSKRRKELLTFLVDCWLEVREDLPIGYIAEHCTKEPLTDENEPKFRRPNGPSDMPRGIVSRTSKHIPKWGYPKTRANLRWLRIRLLAYYQAEGYLDPILIVLTKGSYNPIIVRNTRSEPPAIPLQAQHLIGRIKIALDHRSEGGARRAIDYLYRLGDNSRDPQVCAVSALLPWALYSFLPQSNVADIAIRKYDQASKNAPSHWETRFSAACALTCLRHRQKALEFFEEARESSHQESVYYWWHPALLASLGRTKEAIDIVASALHHFAPTSLALRMDLAMLLIIDGQFTEAEETISVALDFVPAHNSFVSYTRGILYEAQNRLAESNNAVWAWLKNIIDSTNLPGEEIRKLTITERVDLWTKEQPDRLSLLSGLTGFVSALTMPKFTGAAEGWLEYLIEKKKANIGLISSVEIALPLIGLRRYDEACSWLERAAFQEVSPLVMWFHIFPPLRHLRGHPRFEALLKKIEAPMALP